MIAVLRICFAFDCCDCGMSNFVESETEWSDDGELFDKRVSPPLSCEVCGAVHDEIDMDELHGP